MLFDVFKMNILKKWFCGSGKAKPVQLAPKRVERFSWYVLRAPQAENQIGTMRSFRIFSAPVNRNRNGNRNGEPAPKLPRRPHTALDGKTPDGFYYGNPPALPKAGQALTASER
ncbi:MAG: hypothetical protein HZC43_01965 [Nitrosomonadales bacterium]|nr:hypothetical protein [Nitrosomonadales bacterium]